MGLKKERAVLGVLFFALCVCCASAHAAPPITVTSSSVGAAGSLGFPELPDQFGCYADSSSLGISPQLSWGQFPKTTKRFAVIVSDPDAPSGAFFHWGMYNIPKNKSSFAENLGKFSGGGTKQTLNDFGGKGYGGACPPTGEVHRYVFEVFALKDKLTLPATTTAKQLKKALKKQFKSLVAAKGSFTAVYPIDCVSAGNCTEEGCLNRGNTWSCTNNVCTCS